MNDKQQTAVEWLEEQIEWYNKELLFDLMHEIEKAKEMEKWQIKETASAYFHENTKLTPTQYYEQTYGGGEK